MMKIPCASYRGGISKPIFFLESDLPKDSKKRYEVVLEAFGTRQPTCSEHRPSDRDNSSGN
jgi:2-methylaconitate cis-trans-isomerase PrpF